MTFLNRFSISLSNMWLMISSTWSSACISYGMMLSNTICSLLCTGLSLGIWSTGEKTLDSLIGGSWFSKRMALRLIGSPPISSGFWSWDSMAAMLLYSWASLRDLDARGEISICSPNCKLRKVEGCCTWWEIAPSRRYGLSKCGRLWFYSSRSK